MRAPEYDTLRTVEDSHWWHAVLRSLVSRAISGRLPSRARLLDAGCGTGGMLEFLRMNTGSLDLSGLDVSEEAVRHCHQRGLHTVQLGSVEALPFPDAAFDAMLSLDVLYHEGVSEAPALAEMCRVLRSGGLLVLNLPAFAGLRGAHDGAVAGARRYEASQVRALLEAAGLTVETIHYWNAWLFLPLLVWRPLSRLKRPHGSSDLHLTPAWMNPMLAGLGRLDAGMCQMFHIPFGSSVFAVARKINHQPGGRHHGGN